MKDFILDEYKLSSNFAPSPALYPARPAFLFIIDHYWSRPMTLDGIGVTMAHCAGPSSATGGNRRRGHGAAENAERRCAKRGQWCKIKQGRDGMKRNPPWLTLKAYEQGYQEGKASK
ncbi:MAG: hypothetical protein AUK55_11990 [Syntrophobacteraceae bacterium CG2_30_61_12]|nr:MAG: hypothetical protein AUK55_11990 [Syntrophobacteraceae bacterium CG2_30_61_12]PIU31258.1 MAG: hypothetical protein COT06_09125 [Syntrophobacteraceae bacterium CG07_land_8_20_14_0_80_61_8]